MFAVLNPTGLPSRSTQIGDVGFDNGDMNYNRSKRSKLQLQRHELKVIK